MKQAQIELVFIRQMLDRGDEGFFERAIISPAGKEFVDDRVMNLRLAVRSFVNRHFLPLHPGVEDFQNEIESLVITNLAIGAALGKRQVRQDKFLEVFLAELHGNDVIFGLFRLF